MQRRVRLSKWYGLLGVVAGSLVLAGALQAADDPKAEVKSAAQALADKSNYSWKSTVENANGGGGGGRGLTGPTEGKTEKGGYTTLAMTRGQNTLEAALKGDKGAIKTQDGWRSLDEVGQGGGQGGGRGNMMGLVARTLRNFKSPAAEAAALADGITTVAKADGVYSGDLTEDAAKALLTFGRRGGNGGNAPTPTNVKGSAKFWTQDGVLSKYQYNVQGTINFNGNDININRTTTVEIKDVGATTVTVADEAKQKIG